MTDCPSLRLLRCWALLLGVLVAAWAPAASRGVAARIASAPVVGGVKDSGVDDVVVPAVPVSAARVSAARVPALRLSAWAPTGHRSPSWHRGTGRRQQRTGYSLPGFAPVGSNRSADSFIRQPVGTESRSTVRSQVPGRSAASPRAPPAIS